ncbi:MAG TPA: TetR/AcrR family transcriptional regulator [Spirochaetia bacterium]|nr:TetR/AcrR family transcriptional regulator [Spirochaetia bacterium]
MQKRGKKTRERILGSSLRLFAGQGYAATGVAEICAASGVSKGAFYHHFPSKQSIFLTLMQNWLAGVDRRLERSMRASASVPEGLLAMASQMRHVFSAADGRLEIFLEFWQQARREPAVWKGLMAPYRQYRDILAAIVKKGIKEGSFRRIDPVAAGQALETLAIGTLLQGVLDPRGARWDNVIRTSIQLLVEGMANPSAKRPQRPAAETGVLHASGGSQRKTGR